MKARDTELERTRTRVAVLAPDCMIDARRAQMPHETAEAASEVEPLCAGVHMCHRANGLEHTEPFVATNGARIVDLGLVVGERVGAFPSVVRRVVERGVVGGWVDDEGI